MSATTLNRGVRGRRRKWIVILAAGLLVGGIAAKRAMAEPEIDFCQAVGCMQGYVTCFYYVYGVVHNCPQPWQN